MARAGAVVAETLALLEEQIQPGITTGRARRDRRGVHPLAGRRPDVQGLQGLPGGDLPLAERHGRPRHPRHGRSSQDGDILSVDVGVTLDGFVADSAWTFPVGAISAETQRLLDACQAALEAGIARGAARERDRRHLARRPDGHRGGRASASSAASSATASGAPCTRTRRCRTSSPRYAGPGAQGGHDDRDRADDHGRRARTSYVHDDEWSISTSDGSLAAHFEHTVASPPTARGSSRRAAVLVP